MAVPAGTRIGPYEILAPIGAGGMGEVYRARDARLDRDVAIKILPAAFASDVERLARFEREAKTLASLNHPNIAQIYGLEPFESGRALVMEMIEGEDLSDRLARGAMAMTEALPIARQVAEALEAAHERGIIHRDLKPANIKIGEDGRVKVLDFGLAKAFDPAGASRAELMNSPTITSPATQLGMIIGTAAYMSPEQAKGKAVDRRADVWAFGVVLFEMLTGRRAFEGASVTEVLAAVMKDPVPFDALPATVPPAVHRLLRRCLEKDRAKRLDSMGAARLDVDDAIGGGDTAPAVAPPAHGAFARALPWAIAALALAAAGLTGYRAWGTPAATVAPLTRLAIGLGTDRRITPFGAALAISPDGRTIVAAVDGRDGPRPLYVRHLDRFEAAPLQGTEGGYDPFFSPDGRWIGFFGSGRLHKIAVIGGAAVELASAPIGRGGAWGEDGFVYFAGTAGPGARLMRVRETGQGAPEVVGPMLPGHVTQRYPQVLPGAKAVIYTGHINVDTFDEASLVVQPLDGGQPRELLKGGYAWRYVPSGHVVYVHAGTLFAAPFDPDRLDVTGPSAPVVENVIAAPNGSGAQFAAGGGTLVYARGEARGVGERLEWLDLAGTVTPLFAADVNYQALSLSPDGARLAIEITERKETSEIWIHDLARDSRSRLTVNQVADSRPVWTPDGTRIVFASAIGGTPNLFWQPADGSAPAERLTTSQGAQFPGSWHPDGKRLVFTEGMTSFSLKLLTLPEKTVRAIADGQGSEGHPRISRDGRWLAYTSDESGQFEVYVRSFPDGAGRWPVSTAGGAWPLWSPTGRTLYYATLTGELMAVTFDESGGVFQPARPRPIPNGSVFTRSTGYPWDIHPDGKRFAAGVREARAVETARDDLVLIMGWFDELRTRVK